MYIYVHGTALAIHNFIFYAKFQSAEIVCICASINLISLLILKYARNYCGIMHAK